MNTGKGAGQNALREHLEFLVKKDLLAWGIINNTKPAPDFSKNEQIKNQVLEGCFNEFYRRSSQGVLASPFSGIITNYIV